MRPDVAFLYKYWRRFPPERIEVAMDVVGAELPARLAARGRRVTVYSQGGRTRWRTHVDAGVEHRWVPGVLTPLGRTLGRVARAVDADHGRDGSCLPALSYAFFAAADIRRRGIPVVHVSINDEFLPILRALNPRARIVMHMHDHKQAYRSPAVLRRRLAKADAIVGVSEFVTERVRAELPELAPRCRTILNAVDVGLYRPRPVERVRRLVFLGRLTPEKGVHTLIEAFSLVAPRHPEAELLLYGQDLVASLADVDPGGSDRRFAGLRAFYDDRGAYGRHLRTLAPADVRPRVRFLGPVPHADVPVLLAEADALVFPSLWDEPFGLPAIEAAAAGIPVVATRVGGIRETVVDGETGLLVEPGDAAGLASALDRLLSDAALGRRLGEAGRRRAETRFAWEGIAEQWSALYDELALRRAPRRFAVRSVLRSRLSP